METILESLWVKSFQNQDYTEKVGGNCWNLYNTVQYPTTQCISSMMTEPEAILSNFNIFLISFLFYFLIWLPKHFHKNGFKKSTLDVTRWFKQLLNNYFSIQLYKMFAYCRKYFFNIKCILHSMPCCMPLPHSKHSFRLTTTSWPQRIPCVACETHKQHL